MTGLRQIEMEEAVRTLGGSIRLIDGLTPERMLTGRGAGDDLTSFVRVVYQDPPGRELWLDQRRGASFGNREERSDAATAWLPGDTLVTPEPNGARSLSWVDQTGFLLRLTGFLDTDSLVLLRGRVH